MAIGGFGGGIGRVGAKAAETAVGLVQDFVGNGVFPANEYALAAYLFERIAQAEKETAPKDRQYYLDLMTVCLETARDKETGPTPEV